MSLITFSLLLLSSCAVFGQSSENSDTERSSDCGINASYTSCGSACPTTCSNRFLPPSVCIQVCVEGCYCNRGFLRHANGTCVPTSQCSPSDCTPNAEYKKCGTGNPKTCDDVNSEQSSNNGKCVEECFCKGNLVKNTFGLCINPLGCTCDQLREEWSECGALCEDTCDNYKTPTRVCPKICAPGCVCRKPYIRGKEGNCVFPEFC